MKDLDLVVLSSDRRRCIEDRRRCVEDLPRFRLEVDVDVNSRRKLGISSVERENSGLGELEEGEKGRREEERIYLF